MANDFIGPTPVLPGTGRATGQAQLAGLAGAQAADIRGMMNQQFQAQQQRKDQQLELVAQMTAQQMRTDAALAQQQLAAKLEAEAPFKRMEAALKFVRDSGMVDRMKNLDRTMIKGDISSTIQGAKDIEKMVEDYQKRGQPLPADMDEIATRILQRRAAPQASSTGLPPPGMSALDETRDIQALQGLVPQGQPPAGFGGFDQQGAGIFGGLPPDVGLAMALMPGGMSGLAQMQQAQFEQQQLRESRARRSQIAKMQPLPEETAEQFNRRQAMAAFEETGQLVPIPSQLEQAQLQSALRGAGREERAGVREIEAEEVKAVATRHELGSTAVDGTRISPFAGIGSAGNALLVLRRLRSMGIPSAIKDLKDVLKISDGEARRLLAPHITVLLQEAFNVSEIGEPLDAPRRNQEIDRIAKEFGVISPIDMAGIFSGRPIIRLTTE